jgi:hypothetical protein
MIVLIAFRLRPKPILEVKYWWIFPLVILLTLIFGPSSYRYLERMKMKPPGRIRRFILYYYFLAMEVLILLNQKFAYKFTSQYVKLCYYCYRYLKFRKFLLDNKNVKLRYKIVHEILMHINVIPMVSAIFTDMCLWQVHYIYWGLVISFFITMIFINFTFYWADEFRQWLIEMKRNNDNR